MSEFFVNDQENETTTFKDFGSGIKLETDNTQEELPTDHYEERYSNYGLTFKATLKNGLGRYLKGLFKKTERVNFYLDVEIYDFNVSGYKIKSVTAYIKSENGGEIKKRVSKKGECLLFDLPASEFGGNVTAEVVVVYSIGFFKDKTITVISNGKF